MSDYLFDGDAHDGPADREVEALERLLGGFAHDEPLREPLPSAQERGHRDQRDGRVLWAAGLAIAAAVLLVLTRPPRSSVELASSPAPIQAPETDDPTMPFEPPGPSCMHEDDRPTGHACRLRRADSPPGWVASEASPDRTRETGCAYTLTTDHTGAAHLHVTLGAVVVEDGPRSVWVPAGHELRAAPHQPVGLPLVVLASESLRAAAQRFDEGDPAALPELLRELSSADVGTAWNLLQRASEDARPHVLERIETLYAPDSSIRRALADAQTFPN